MTNDNSSTTAIFILLHNVWYQYSKLHCFGNFWPLKIVRYHNLTPYNHFKNKPVECDVKYHKSFECVLLVTKLVLRENGTAHGPTNCIKAKVIDSSHGSVIMREELLSTRIRLSTTTPNTSLILVLREQDPCKIIFTYQFVLFFGNKFDK